jgi:RNA polymerase sigma-70 factor (ECF subfamily)
MNAPSHQRHDELIPTRQSLLERLKDLDDSGSWREFFEIYWRLIYNVALKAGLSEVEAQEVVQETVIAVSRHIDEFEYDPKRGSFKNWLLKMTRWRILDHFRKLGNERKNFAHHPQADPAGSTPRTATVDRIPDPRGDGISAVWEEEWQKNLLEAALERVKERVEPRHFQVFYSYVLKQQPVRTVCRMFGINAAQVYMIKHRVSAQIKKQMKVLEKRLA